MTRRLLVASGGGGDAIAAAMVAADPLGAEELLIASFSWDRLIVDPIPGPRTATDFVDLAPVGHHNFRVLPTSATVPPAASSLPRLAAWLLPARLYLLDPYRGVIGLRQQLEELVALVHVDHIEVLDVGGDILAAGNEPGLRSPLADSLTLAAVHAVDSHASVSVAGPGLDGELTEAEVCNRCRVFGVTSAHSVLSRDQVFGYGRIFEWHLSEATGMLRAAAMGIRGAVELRDHGALVPLTERSAEVWRVHASSAFEKSLTARALVGTASLEEAESALIAIGRPSEIEYERRKARRLPDEREMSNINEIVSQRLTDIEDRAAARGADYITFRRLAELLGLRATSISELRQYLALRGPRRYLPPLWATRQPAERQPAEARTIRATSGVPLQPVVPHMTRPTSHPPAEPPPLTVTATHSIVLRNADRGRHVIAGEGATINVCLAEESARYYWTKVTTSDPGVLAPVDVRIDAEGRSLGAFRAQSVGQATLAATKKAPPYSRSPDFLWQVTVGVRTR